MGISIEWLSEFIDAFIDGDAKKETEEYDCTETTWDVFKAYAFFWSYDSTWAICLAIVLLILYLGKGYWRAGIFGKKGEFLIL